MRRNLFVALAVIFTCSALLLAACGRNRDENGDSGRNEPPQPSQAVGTAALETVTLSVAASPAEASILNAAAASLAREMAEAGFQFEMNLTLYPLDTPEEIDAYITNIVTRLVAGQGYDIIMHHPGLPTFGLLSNNLLADIYPLIDQCPHSSRQDYFANVLEALEVGGGLYTFPLGFNIEFVGINAALPTEFINRFAGYSAASMNQIAAIFNDLQASEFENMSAGFHLRHEAAVLDFLGNYIDWNTSEIHANAEQFAEFLENKQSAFSGNTRFNHLITTEMLTNPRGGEVTGMLSELFAFSNMRFNLDPVLAFLPFHNPYYVHYIPLVSENGGLAAWDATSQMYSISATADGDLAWAFLRHLAVARAEQPLREFFMRIPIARDFFRDNMAIAFRNAISNDAVLSFAGQGNRGAEDMLIDEAIQRLEGYLSIPVSGLQTRILLPAAVFSETYTRLLYENVNPQLAANAIIATTEEWLTHAHSLDVDTEILSQMELEAHAMAGRENLPVRTLSVHAQVDYANIIRQAVEVMNLAWAMQGIQYNLELDLTTYNWDDLEAVSARMQVMLMAGIGYDLMFSGLRTPYHIFANSGLLLDIYTLIDQCPRTSRSDFYENVLEAFEVNGGLYGLPLSFGFDWVGINAALPQQFIDRFAEYDRISTSSKMSLYNDLMATGEFRQLRIGEDLNIGNPRFMLSRALGGFIDLNNRTANFVDGQFANFLEDFKAIYGSRGFDADIRPLMTWYPWTDVQLRLRADRYVFFYRETLTNPANALFAPVDPFFTYYIPVSDEKGRFPLNISGGHWGPFWGTVHFPAAGDSILAWEFTQHLMDAFLHPEGAAARNHNGLPAWGSNSFAIPIRRADFNIQIPRTMEQVLIRRGSQFENVTYNREQVIDDAIARLMQYIDEPMVVPVYIPNSIWEQTITDIENFMWGIITAQSAAQNIQNRVALWLIE